MKSRTRKNRKTTHLIKQIVRIVEIKVPAKQKMKIDRYTEDGKPIVVPASDFIAKAHTYLKKIYGQLIVRRYRHDEPKDIHQAAIYVGKMKRLGQGDYSQDRKNYYATKRLVA